MDPPAAERSMNTYLSISETLAKDEPPPPAIAAADYVYIEGYLVSSATGRAAAIELRHRARDAKARTALSLSDPARVQYFREGLHERIGDGVDLLICKRAEAMSFTGSDRLEGAAQALLDYCR